MLPSSLNPALSDPPASVAGTLAGLWRYPISSCRGEALASALLAPEGFPMDRHFAIVDRRSGQTATPERERRWHPTPRLRARYRDEAGALEVAIDEQAFLGAHDPALDTALTEHFGFEVDIRPYVPQQADDVAAVHRFRRAQIHLITQTSLDSLSRHLADSEIDVRRFRPNLLVTTAPGEHPCPEAEWIGRRLRIGGVTIEITDFCNRCSFTTLAQAELPLDLRVLRTLIGSFNRQLGVVGKIVEAGRLAVGDPIAFSQ
jgi:uncharacterized protein YcbX